MTTLRPQGLFKFKDKKVKTILPYFAYWVAKRVEHKGR